jgi:hypothetical protein
MPLDGRPSARNAPKQGTSGACGRSGPYFRNAVAAWDNDGFLVAGEGPYAFITDAPADGFTYTRDGLQKIWVRAFTQLEADMLYIGEAPIDGQNYVRSNATWVVDTAAITDAPNDGLAYGRSSVTPGGVMQWVEVVTPPLDAGVY